MLSIRSSGARGRNPDFVRVPRKRGEDNVAWLARNSPKEACPCIVLLGGAGPVDFRVRVAQSHARHTLTPSHWSHAALLLKNANIDLAEAPLFEISLHPPAGFGYPPVSNAIQETAVAQYTDAKAWPNIALIQLPLAMEDVKRMIRKFTYQRSSLDAVELLVAWLAFAWGVGASVNPLLNGMGLPSASMLEHLVGALQYELTPGLDSRSTCPEAIWQSALWWHEYYEQSGGKRLVGNWVVDHGLVDNRMMQE